MNSLGRYFFFFFFLPFLPREITFVTSCLLYWMPSSFWMMMMMSSGLTKCQPMRIICVSLFWKGVYSIRKEFAPSGSKFFPYRVDPFPKGTKQFWQDCPLESVSIPHNNGSVIYKVKTRSILSDWQGFVFNKNIWYFSYVSTKTYVLVQYIYPKYLDRQTWTNNIFLKF